MALRLHHSPNSPYVRKVMVLLHEAGRTAEVALVPAAGSPVDPGTMPVALNPLGKIPCLERPDGPALFDSRVICRYLDALFSAGLYPAGARLWDTLVLEALGDGIMDAGVLMRYEATQRPEPARSDAWVAAQWSKVARALDAVEGRWIAYLAGPFDMGHAAMACALGYLDVRHGGRDWRAGRPALAAWAARAMARDSLKATVPPG
jgi:glutathione S-transferase